MIDLEQVAARLARLESVVGKVPTRSVVMCLPSEMEARLARLERVAQERVTQSPRVVTGHPE